MHLLAKETAALDEADAAVDLEQTAADIVVLSFADSDLAALAEAWARDAANLPTLRLASLKRLKHPMSVDLYTERVVSNSRLVIVRCLGGLDYWRYGLETFAAEARGRGIMFAALPGDDRTDARLDECSSVPADVLARFDGYLRAGGQHNALQLLRYAGHLLGRGTTWTEPVAFGAAIGFARDGRTIPIAALSREATDTRPLALVVFYRALISGADTAPLTALIDALEAAGLAARALAVSSLKDPAAEADIVSTITALRPAVILNATAFSAMRNDGSTVLDAAGAPVLQVVLSGTSREAWTASARGLSPTDIAMNVVLPEFDGRLFTRAISFKAEHRTDPRLEFAVVRHVPDQERVACVAGLAAGWARLAAAPARQRRIAIVLSDYPARAGRAGYAVGLDTAESTAAILDMLRGAGYGIGQDCMRSADVDPLICGGGERLSIPIADYRDWLCDLPEALGREITDTWGEPEHDPAAQDGRFVLPVLRAGNVLIALQPDRGAPGDRKAGYHDTAVPPRHAYVAFYLWLRRGERIDAMVHLGTHGTLEWLPGKALALSNQCWPEALVGPLPVIYPFIVNNPGEAMQAKRRLGAVTIGHLTPPLSAAGLREGCAELEALVEEYAGAEGLDRRRLPLLEAEIIDRAWASGLAVECRISRDMPARDAVALLDARLCDLKELAIRDSLHVFGRSPDSKARAALTEAILSAAPNAGARADQVEAIDASIVACAAAEQHALLSALDGRRVAPGPAGAPSRGRADVLPTGRNLTAIDPRAIPTRVAAAIGVRAADEILRRHLQDHGEYPRALVLDMWASASLRTGGDDLAQALWYLGARPLWDPTSSRVTGVEVLPPAAVGRPRIDVTLRVSGLFRDIFESQITLFDLAVQRVAGLDEDDADNPLSAARRRGADLSRVFGAAPGSYGAQAAAAALDTPWATRADLGEAYLASVTHAFAGGGAILPAGQTFADRVADADALVHPQDDGERDLLDGDGVADFAGGFAAAAALIGRDPALYHLDTSKPEAPKARTMPEEVARVVRGRLSNPRWLAGMLAHGARGVSEIAQGVDALYAFAATADAVHAHVFDLAHAALIADENLFSQMIERNPRAAEAIAERLSDAHQRGLWVSRRNAVAGELAHAVDLARAATRPAREAAR